MTTTTGGSRWPREGRLHRVFMWAGHYHERIILAAIALAIADDLSGRPAILAAAVAVMFVAWFAAFLFGAQRHDRSLCERCISEAPTLNPQGAVERWKRMLWAFHQKRANIILLGIVLAWIIGSTQFRHEPLWARGLDAAGMVVLGYSYVRDRVHRRLYPWCPYCHWGDGGDEEVAPVAPEDHGVKA